MRIFTGILLAEEAKENIMKELDPFRRIAPSIRWTGKGNIHLTLKFVGDAAPALCGRIADALAAAAIPVAPFRLRFRGFGTFPAADGLQVFWAGVEDEPRLRSLFHAVEALLLPLGIARDARPFQPHLTLGRNKAPSMRGGTARADFRALFAQLAEKKDLDLGASPVSAFQLFRSDLTPAGPVYSILKEIPLVQS